MNKTGKKVGNVVSDIPFSMSNLQSENNPHFNFIEKLDSLQEIGTTLPADDSKALNTKKSKNKRKHTNSQPTSRQSKFMFGKETYLRKIEKDLPCFKSPLQINFNFSKSHLESIKTLKSIPELVGEEHIKNASYAEVNDSNTSVVDYVKQTMDVLSKNNQRLFLKIVDLKDSILSSKTEKIFQSYLDYLVVFSRIVG